MANLADKIRSLTPESQLLIQCARVSSDREHSGQSGHIFREDLDWANLLKVANYPHGVLPLLHNYLQCIGADGIPEPWLERLQECYRQVALKNLYITGELLRVVQLLNKHGIQVVPFKGPSLAISAYGNVALRQFCDLDLFLRHEDVQKAIGILVSENYRLSKFMVEQIPALMGHKKDFQLVHKNKEVVLEIHWRLVGKRFPLSLEVEQLWHQLKTVNVSGTPVSSFPPEEMLLYLSVHGSKHLWERLIWVADVAHMINKTPDLDWERLGQLADIHGCRRMVNLAFVLAYELLGAHVPAGPLSIARADKVALTLAERAVDKLFNKGVRVYRPTEVHGFHIKMRERLRDKVVLGYYYSKDFCKVLATPNDADKNSIALPDRLDFLYYLLRPLRLFHTAFKR